jgi:hypothetical protein
MRKVTLCLVALLGVAAAPVRADVPVSLRGSPQSMARQNEIAKGYGLAFAKTPADLRALEEEGALVRLEGNEHYAVADFVSFPYARPEMRTFIERLSAQYRAATGEKLVVTSLARPASRQPGNSHALSVHPTGVAVDLRVSQRAESRQWLENTLLSLEQKGLLDITREYRPPHYHVALFPEPYMAHVERLVAQQEAEAVVLAAAVPEPAAIVGRAFIAPQAQEHTRTDRPIWPTLVAIPLVLLATLALRQRTRVASRAR